VIADEMRKNGWPGLEVRRWADGFWTATFFKYTPFSDCTIKAIGKGLSICEAILKAKEKADAQR
jgi:hypothetical protein